MASKGRRKGKSSGKPAARPTEKSELPGAKALPAHRTLDPALRRRGQVELAGGAILVIVGIVLAMRSDGETLAASRFLLVYALGVIGVLAIAIGASRLDRREGAPVTTDKRRWIYGVLASLFAVIYALLMWKVIPNRLPSAMLHLATVPVFTLVMAVGTLIGGRVGWWIAVIGGSTVLLSTIVLIARILASAAFLAGVYGAFGKAASTFALVSVALIIEIVGLLPICQVKFLMSRPGRRAYGV
jgi:hypothetical protein